MKALRANAVHWLSLLPTSVSAVRAEAGRCRIRCTASGRARTARALRCYLWCGRIWKKWWRCAKAQRADEPQPNFAHGPSESGVSCGVASIRGAQVDGVVRVDRRPARAAGPAGAHHARVGRAGRFRHGGVRDGRSGARAALLARCVSDGDAAECGACIARVAREPLAASATQRRQGRARGGQVCPA